MENVTYSTLALRTAPDREGTADGRQRTRDLDISPKQKEMLLMALGLCGEAGEVAEMIKKHVFHGHPMDAEKITKLIRELGDVQWYINYGAVRVCDVGLDTVMDRNIDKLAARYPAGFFDPAYSLNRKPGDD